MATIENRAAENGSIVIADTEDHYFNPTRPAVALRILETSQIDVMETLSSTEGAKEYYEARATLSVDDPVILANITHIRLISGAVQAIFS